MKEDFEEIIKSSEKIKKHYFSKRNDEFIAKQRENGKHYRSLRYSKPKYSRDELIGFLLKNQIKTEVDLKRKRKDLDPFIKDYKKEFGSWLEAKKAAWGLLDTSLIDYTTEQLIKLAIENNVKRAKQFQELHKKFPDIFPSIKRIYKIWGIWRNFIDSVEKMCDSIQVNKYMDLGRKLLRVPSRKEAEDANIYLDKMIKTWAKSNGVILKHSRKYYHKKMFDDYIFRTLMKKEYNEWKRLRSYYFDKPISAKD